MKINLNLYDRILRVLFAVMLVVSYYFDVLPGVLSVTAILATAYLLITSSLAICPLYLSFNITTVDAE